MSMQCELNPHEKSMQFLREVCNIDGIEMIDSNSIYKIVVRIRGRSGGTMRSKPLVQSGCSCRLHGRLRW